MKENVLKIRDLSISFNTDSGVVEAIRGIRLDLFRGETLAIVGESGSGKSVTTKAIMGILSNNAILNEGSIVYSYEDQGVHKEVDLLQMSSKDLSRDIRGQRIAMVFQDPMTTLNPTMSIGKQVMEAMIYHWGYSKKVAYEKSVALLERVGIVDAEKRMKHYPHQLSGGMRQRVVIAIALSCEPDVLICDEPTTALDVTIQAKILELIQDVQKERHISVIYITHDLGVVAKVADYVAVMYAGKIVEKGAINEVFYDPRHPYTWGLLSAMPDLDTVDESLYAIPGSPPTTIQKLQGDAFAPRNEYALNIDFRLEPPLFDVGGSHRVASWLCHELAPNVARPHSLEQRIIKMRKEAGLDVPSNSRSS